MSVPILGSFTSSDVKNTIESVHGITLPNSKFSTFRDNAEFDLFNTDYHEGATDLSGINKMGQFRGYGENFDMLGVFFTVLGDTKYKTSIALCDFYKTSDDSLIGTSQMNFNHTNESTYNWEYFTLLGETGVNTLACPRGLGHRASYGLPVIFYINPKLIIANYGAFYCKLRGLRSGLTATVSSDSDLDYSNLFEEVNYRNNANFRADTPHVDHGAVFLQSSGDQGIGFPLKYNRTWNATLITVTFSEFY